MKSCVLDNQHALIHSFSSLRPRLSATGTDTVFTGWARFAIPIYKFAITRVEKPLLGFIKPARVRAEVTVDLAPFQQQVRQEWYEIREHDVFFLITVRATIPMHVQVDESEMVVSSYSTYIARMTFCSWLHYP